MLGAEPVGRALGRAAQVRLAQVAQIRLAQVGLGVALDPQEVGPVAVIQVGCRGRERPGIESDSRRAAGARRSRRPHGA